MERYSGNSAGAKREKHRKLKADRYKEKEDKAKEAEKEEARKIELESTPHSFVFHHGVISKDTQHLIADFRLLMSPHTATRLKVLKGNTMRDFVHAAKELAVSHFAIFSMTELGQYVRFMKVPQGPTLTFHLEAFSLCKDVLESQRRGIGLRDSKLLNSSPLVVLNNFNSEENHVKLMATIFQNMFPPISVQTIKLMNCRRVVLFNYDKASGKVEIRHYYIRAQSTEIGRAVQRLASGSRLPNLKNMQDISDFILNGGHAGNMSESEADDPEDVSSRTVTLSEPLTGVGNVKDSKSAVKLIELGPRLSLSLMKIEDGLSTGDVIYHSRIQKTAEEVAELRRRRKQKEALKKKRQEEQEANVRRKEAEKEAKLQRLKEKKARRIAKIAAKEAGDDVSDISDEEKEEADEEDNEEGKATMSESESEPEEEAIDEAYANISDEEYGFEEDGQSENEADGGDAESSGDDSDADWYRQEVGAELDEESLSKLKSAASEKKERYNPMWKGKQTKQAKEKGQKSASSSEPAASSSSAKRPSKQQGEGEARKRQKSKK